MSETMIHNQVVHPLNLIMHPSGAYPYDAVPPIVPVVIHGRSPPGIDVMHSAPTIQSGPSSTRNASDIGVGAFDRVPT